MSSGTVHLAGDIEGAPMIVLEKKKQSLRHAKVGLEILDIIATPDNGTCPLPVTMMLSLAVYVAACVVLIGVTLHMDGETIKVTHIGHHIRYPERGKARHNKKMGFSCKSLSLMDQTYTYLDTVDGVAWGVDAFSLGMNNKGVCEQNFDALEAPTFFALADAANATIWGACLGAADSYRSLDHLAPQDCDDMIRAASITTVKNVVAIHAPRCDTTSTGCYSTAAEVQAAWALGDAVYRSNAHMRAFCDNFDTLPPYACSWDARVHVMQALGIAWGFVDLIFVLSTMALALLSFSYAKAADIKEHGFSKAVYMYLSFLGGVTEEEENSSDDRLRDLEARLTRLESSSISTAPVQPFAAASSPSSSSSSGEEKQHQQQPTAERNNSYYKDA